MSCGRALPAHSPQARGRAVKHEVTFREHDLCSMCMFLSTVLRGRPANGCILFDKKLFFITEARGYFFLSLETFGLNI